MIKCQVEDTRSTFSFTSDSTSLTAAINKAVSVTSFSKGLENEIHHFMLASNKKLFILGMSTETFSVFQVAGIESEGEGIFEFNTRILIGLIKNRAVMEYEFANGRISFKSVKGKYKGDTVTTTVEAEMLPQINKSLKPSTKSDAQLTGDMLVSLRAAMKATHLKNFYGDDQIVCLIRAKAGKLEVSAYDNFHTAYYKAKIEDKAQFKLALPVTMFNLIDKFITDEGEDALFHMGSKRFSVHGKSYSITLPAVQMEDDQFNMVPDYLRSLKNPLIKMKFTQDGIKTVDNMFTIADDDSRLAMKVNNKGITKISMSTDTGTIEDAFKTETTIDGKQDSVTFLIDPRVFGDLFDKVRSKKEIPMQLFSKENKGVTSCFMITSKTETSQLFLIGTYYDD